MAQPHVFILAAQSSDGFIATDSNHFTDWTSKEDKELFKQLTHEAGVVVMGRSTFQTLPRALPGRKNVVYTKQSLEFDPQTTQLTDLNPADLVKKLALEGFSKIAIIGGQQIYDMFLKSGVVDEMYLIIEPISFGDGIKLNLSQPGLTLHLIESRNLNSQTVLHRYKVEKGV